MGRLPRMRTVSMSGVLPVLGRNFGLLRYLPPPRHRYPAAAKGLVMRYDREAPDDALRGIYNVCLGSLIAKSTIGKR
jgi:hypothetical protein